MNQLSHSTPVSDLPSQTSSYIVPRAACEMINDPDMLCEFQMKKAKNVDSVYSVYCMYAYGLDYSLGMWIESTLIEREMESQRTERSIHYVFIISHWLMISFWSLDVSKYF